MSLPVPMEGSAYKLKGNVMEGTMTVWMDRMSGQVCVEVVQIYSLPNLPVPMEGSAYNLDGDVMGTLTARMDRTNWKIIVGIVQIQSLPVQMEGSVDQLNGNVMECRDVTTDQ